MAIDIDIKGKFELSAALRAALLAVLPSDAVVKWRPRKRELDIDTDLVLVRGAYLADETALFFRVDKERVNEGLNLVVSCADAVLAATHADLRMSFNSDVRLLERRKQDVKLFVSPSEGDRTFWRSFDRSSPPHHPFRFVSATERAPRRRR